MITVDVMERIAGRLKTIAGLNVLVGEVGTIMPPGAIVGLPIIRYDMAYKRGADHMAVAVMVVWPNPKQESSWRNLLPYTDGAGAKSVRAALRVAAPGEVAAFGTLIASEAEPSEVTISGAPYAAYIFAVELRGEG